jgi:chromosome segregation ATPase
MSAKSDKNNKKERTEKSPDAVTNTGRQESSDYRVMVFSTKRVLLAVTILNAALFFGGTLLSSITIKSITERYEKAVQIIKETEKDYYDAKSTLDNINREVDVLNAKIIAKIEDITKDINDKKIGAITKIDNSVTAVEQKQEEATPKITTALTTAEQAVSKITASVTAVEEKQEEATSKITTALTNVEEKQEEATSKIDDVAKRIEPYYNKIIDMDKSLGELTRKVNVSKTRLEEAQKGADDLVTHARNIHSEIEEILANLVQNETFTFIDIWKHTDWMVKCVLIACVVLPLLLILYIIVRKPFKQNGLQR